MTKLKTLERARVERLAACAGPNAIEMTSTTDTAARSGERRGCTWCQAIGRGRRRPAITCEDAVDMPGAISTRFPQLLSETLQAKAGHLTVGGCLTLGGVAALAGSWDEINCVAGDYTSSGPCGIGIVVAGQVLFVALIAIVAGTIILARALRRPVDPEGGGGWRLGPGFVVIACGILLALMIPRYSCPAGYVLTPVFRFCTSIDRSFSAQSTGMPWKFGVLALGFVVGVGMMWWRTMPWWLSTGVTVVVFAVTLGFTLRRTVGLPF